MVTADISLARVCLLVHILDVIMDGNRNDKSDYQETVTIKKLEEYTWENTAAWFNDKDGKNASKRVFLKDIFRVAKMEERYRKGELGTLVKGFAIVIAHMQQM